MHLVPLDGVEDRGRVGGMTATTFPHSQHWTTGGFRFSVLFYKRDNHGYCAECGVAHARHHVWAEGKGELDGFRGNADYCDEHRPAKGTVPDLDYVRLVRGGMTGPLVYERLSPWLGEYCSECGGAAIYRAEHRCGGCDDPEQTYTTQRIAIRPEAVTEHAPETHHRLHTTSREFRCRAHPLEVAA